MRYLIHLILLFSILASYPLRAQEIENLKNCELDSIDGMAIFSIVEIQPEYVGGIQKFYSDISSKIKVKAKNEIGCIKVVLSFVIDNEGNIRNFCYTDNVEISMEIIDLLNNWTAGKNNGVKVPVRMHLPMCIKFG